MKKFIHLVLLIFAFNIYVQSQELILGFKTGVGTYSMTDLKPINDVIPHYLSFDTRLVADFPPYFYYQPVLIKKFTHYSIGLIYSFQSTGSRLSAKDYSGEYRFDMKVNSNNAGIINEVKILSVKKYEFSIYSNLGVSYSSLKLNEFFNALDSTLLNHTTKFKSLNYYFEPGITSTYLFTPLFSIGINAGYLKQFGNEAFYSDGKKGNKMLNPVNRKPIKPDWNGLRIGISFYYTIRNINNKK